MDGHKDARQNPAQFVGANMSKIMEIPVENKNNDENFKTITRFKKKKSLHKAQQR